MGGENPQVTWAKPHSPTLIPDLRLLNFLCQGCLGLLLARNHGLGMPPWTADELCVLWSGHGYRKQTYAFGECNSLKASGVLETKHNEERDYGSLWWFL